jgi:glycerol-3-phosphate dehydrogenase
VSPAVGKSKFAVVRTFGPWPISISLSSAAASTAPGNARDAAGRGLKVLLLEQGDLASGMSSASSKLIHGGLRYLEQARCGLSKGERSAPRSNSLTMSPLRR